MSDSRSDSKFDFKAGRRLRLAALLLAFVSLAGCVPFQLLGILDGPTGKPLSLSPETVIIQANGTITFSAQGGVPPYLYSIVSGGGTLDQLTGVYTAPLVVGSAEIRVTDATNKSAKAVATIQVFPSSLAISPASLSLQVGSNVTFSAIGGTPPYTFSMQTNNSGTIPGINPVTGYYVAGETPVTVDTIRVTDAASGTATASVSVTVLTSTVDYTIAATSFPAIGTVSTAIPGGSTFSLKNSGSGAGTQNVDWKVFLSTNSVIDGGDFMVASGTASALAPGATALVGITGTFPAVAPGPWFLIAQANAPDDTTSANNSSGASALTLSPLDVNYTVPSVTGTPGIAGTSMSGSLDVSNIGGAAGSAAVSWTVYASVDAVLDASDYLVARGTLPPLGAGGSSGPVGFLGYWPSTPNTWRLIAQVSADDDVAPGNNTAVSAPIVVPGPPPPNVDYVVTVVNNGGGATAGDPLSGTFTAKNNGADAGGQPVFWTAYLSSNTTLEIGTDPVLDSGTFAPLGSGASLVGITFGGTWPSGPGTWRLIVAVSGSDDVTPTNNVTVSGPVSTTAPDVDYTVQSVVSDGGTTAGSPLSGTFVIHNAGTHAGSQFIPLSIYLSTDASLSVGTDRLLAAGSIPAPGLAAGGSTAPMPFADTWPASNAAKTWYLIAHVGAGDDVNPTNDSGSSAAVLVNPPNINYRVTSVTSTGGTTGGGAITATFVLDNIGTAAGTVPVAWTAYLSANTTLDVTDQVLATGLAGPLAGGGTTGALGFGGNWPAGAGTWYLIVKADASDDTTPGNNVQVSALIPVTSSAPVYSITSVPLPVGPFTAQAVSGTFTVQNMSPNDGLSPITWQVYASLGDAVYNSGDILLASGSAAGIAGLGSSSPAWAGTWPAASGTYYIVVRISAVDAAAVPDAASAAIVVADPPPPDYTVAFNVGIPWSGLVSTAMNLTGTCQVTIQNLSANPGHSSIAWAVYISSNSVLDAGDVLVQQGSIGPLAGSGSSTFAFAGTWPAAPGVYYLIATARAADDTISTNNVVPAAHPSVTGNYRYKEGVENNNDNGPPPPALTNVSDTLVTTLGANQTLVIEGAMDAYNLYDTYKFTTVASMSKLSMSSYWMTGFDDIDLYLWDNSGTNLYSVSVGLDSEPGASTFNVTGVTPRVCFVSANFYLASNTSGSTGKTYVIVVTGKP